MTHQSWSARSAPWSVREDEPPPLDEKKRTVPVSRLKSAKWEKISIPFARALESSGTLTMRKLLRERPGGVGPTRGRHAIAFLEHSGRAMYSARVWRLTDFGKAWLFEMDEDVRVSLSVRDALAQAHSGRGDNDTDVWQMTVGEAACELRRPAAGEAKAKYRKVRRRRRLTNFPIPVAVARKAARRRDGKRAK